MWKIELETQPVPQGLDRERHARIIVGAKTLSGNFMPRLSPEVMTMGELEHNVRMLRKQLDDVERAGHKYFSA